MVRHCRGGDGHDGEVGVDVGGGAAWGEVCGHALLSDLDDLDRILTVPLQMYICLSFKKYFIIYLFY